MKKLILKHVTNGCFWMNFAVFFKFCTFEKMPENQLLAKKQVTLALMMLFGHFHLFKLARACTSLDKPKKVLCRFTDVVMFDFGSCHPHVAGQARQASFLVRGRVGTHVHIA